MMIVIIFSQMAMEIHAYSFIAGQNIKIKEAKDKAEMDRKLENSVIELKIELLKAKAENEKLAEQNQELKRKNRNPKPKI